MARAIALLAFIAVLVTGCIAVSPPPSDAPPDVVLQAYLHAVQDGDCTTARSLGTSTFYVGTGDLCGVVRIYNFSISPDPATPSPDDSIFLTTLTTSGDGHSIEPGDTTWFFDMKKQSDGSWRLVGGGSGP